MTQLRVAELDFDTIKANLIAFLRSKPEFTDYDFEGSGLSVIMDLLAYNTHYNAVIANMLIQEVYLDTAVKPASLALIAKRMGYVPTSRTAPRATVQLEVFPTDTPLLLTLGKGAQFTATVNSTDRATFITRDAYTVIVSHGRYIFTGVDIYEGAAATFRYVVDTTQQQRFEIPSPNVDISLLRVYVQDNSTSTNIVEYARYDTLIDLKSDTLAYFVKLNENLNYEIYFGDGVLGTSILDNQIVILDYVDTNGPVANGASKFTFNDTVQGYSNVILSTTTAAYGGAEMETNDSIRRNAQNTLFAQNRAVTESDYATVVSKFLNYETISVWGGETLTPPVYGKVFISVKLPNTIDPLGPDVKADLITQLKSRSTMGMVHEFVDPEYIFLTVNTEIKYDARKTTLSPSTIITTVNNSLTAWSTANLNRFSSSFEYSKLVAFIDGIDTSFYGNDTKLGLRKNIAPVFGTNMQYVTNFYCDIIESNSINSTITSTPFRTMDDVTKDVYIADAGGILYTYYIANAQKVVLNDNVGTVDYTLGKLTLTTTVVSAANNAISISVVPNNLNTIQSRNNIMILQSNDITVTLKAI